MVCPSHWLCLSLRVRMTGRCMLTVYVGTEGAWRRGALLQGVCCACACGGGRQAEVNEPEDAAGARWSEMVQCNLLYAIAAGPCKQTRFRIRTLCESRLSSSGADRRPSATKPAPVDLLPLFRCLAVLSAPAAVERHN